MPIEPNKDSALPAGVYSLSAIQQLVAQRGVAKADRSDTVDASLAIAIDCLEKGDAKSALQAASQACHRAPHRPESHYAYGQAWAALGRFPEAERAFAAVVQLAPTWADAWVNYGLARYRQNVTGDAIIAMREALLHAPGHAAATANLAVFLRLAGDGENAEALLRTTLALEPGNIAARLNIVSVCLQEERSDEALALLDAAPIPDDLSAARHIHLARAHAHSLKGNTIAAWAALTAFTDLGPVPTALAPLWHVRRLMLAIVERDEPRARAEAERTELSLAAMGADAIPENRIITLYDLAKFWWSVGAYGRAFGLWTKAHRLLARSQPFSRREHGDFVDANIATFTRRRFVDGPRARNSDPTPVFIVGMPRSGTTLCEQILAAHRDVQGAGERAALGAIQHRLGGETPEAVARLAALDEAALERAAQDYLVALRALAPGKARIVDKMPGNYKSLALVGLMFPGARIIHCMRDPRDIGLSIFSYRFHGEHPYAHDLGDLGWTIRQQERLMAHWKAVLPDPVLSVALSDWVEDFDGTLARVLAHLDLPADPACARFYERDSSVRTVSRPQVRQPINARGLGRWRACASQLAPLIAELGIDEIGTVGQVTGGMPQSALRVVSIADPARALGLATNYLMSKSVFAGLHFGQWAQVLSTQVERGHYRLFADADGRIRGFFGWALTDHVSAEDWLNGRRMLNSTDSRFGDCVIFNAWAADNLVVHRFMWNEMRRVAENTTALYYRRFYPDGRVRPMRLPSTKFLRGHIERATASQIRPVSTEGCGVGDAGVPSAEPRQPGDTDDLRSDDPPEQNAQRWRSNENKKPPLGG